MHCDAHADDPSGTCPRCERPTEWLPVDGARRGRICRGCGWVEMPDVPIVRHTVGSLMRRWFPNSRLTEMLEYIELWIWRRFRREGSS